MSPWLCPAMAVFASLAAAWTDLLTGKIPNRLTVSVALLGIALQGLQRGVLGVLTSLTGLMLCASVPLILYLASRGRGIGGGDLKLFAALGALLGPTQGLEVELSAILLLVVFALFRLAFEGRLLRTLLASARALLELVHPRLACRVTGESVALTEMRMGPAIAAGVAMVLLLPSLMRWLPWLG